MINKLIELYKTNKTLVIISFGILFVIIIMILSLFDNNNATNELISQPLQYYENREVIIPSDLVYTDKWDKDNVATIYDLDLSDKLSNIEIFITNLGITDFKYQNQANIVHTWSGNFGLVEYISNTQSLSFGFKDGIELEALNQTYISVENMDKYFQLFIDNYINLDLDYANYKVERDGRNYIVESNQIINGLLLHTSGFSSYSDRLEFDNQGRLLRGSLILVSNLNDENSFEVDLVHPTNLNDLVSDPIYPKEVNQGAILNIGNSSDDSLPYDSHEYEYPEVESTTANSIELVYFYSNNSTVKLLPMYYITGSGEVTYKGIEYSVPMTIYVNAINPDNVLIPSGIKAQ